MSNRDALRKELVGLPEPMVGRVVDFVRILKAQKNATDEDIREVLAKTFGLLPQLERAPQGEMPLPKNLT